eukprot:SAG31_NODE_7093_length_1791_cov_0.833924_3_plen_193_part_00
MLVTPTILLGIVRLGLQVYLDDMMAGWEVYNNTIENAEVGVFLSGGRRNHIKFNNFRHCDVGVHVDDRGVWPGAWGGDISKFIITALAQAGCSMTWPTVYHPIPRRRNNCYRDARWAVAYPTLPNILSEHAGWPEFNEIMFNNFSESVGVALAGVSNWPTYPSNMTVATLERYHSIFSENIVVGATQWNSSV